MSDEPKETDVQAAIPSHGEPDPAAGLEAIFRRHHRLVFRAAYRVTGNPMDAEDAMQTVFMRLLRRDGGAGLTDDPGGYLRRAAVNAALDIQRSRRNQRASSLEDVAPALATDDVDSQERRVGSLQIRARVRQALGALSPKAAEVFALRYFEGYGNNEIATMLGTSRSTVGVMLHRARQTLRDEIRALQEIPHGQE